MNANQQFAVSCHILALLASNPDTALTSETIAESVDTNAVVIRRIMAHLRQHGLVDSRPGATGGWRLVCPAAELSLRRVYQAVSHDSVLAMHQHPNPDCPIGGNIQSALGDVFDDAQLAMELALDRFNLANLLDILKEKQNK
ncbi:MAG TPA: Rrf2 family transcriptional regulator [Anaerolineales bacterium]|jgi:Rrf2 family protein